MDSIPTNETKAATPSETNTRTRRVFTMQEKAEYLALFEESGMSPEDFAHEMKIKEGTFALWRRLARAEVEGSESPAQFAEVQLAASSPTYSPATVTLTLTNGSRLEVSAVTEAVWQGLGLLLKTINT